MLQYETITESHRADNIAWKWWEGTQRNKIMRDQATNTSRTIEVLHVDAALFRSNQIRNIYASHIIMELESWSWPSGNSYSWKIMTRITRHAHIRRWDYNVLKNMCTDASLFTHSFINMETWKVGLLSCGKNQNNPIFIGMQILQPTWCSLESSPNDIGLECIRWWIIGYSSYILLPKKRIETL